MDYYKIAVLVQENNEDEAEAIKGYTNFLESLDESNIEEIDKTFIKSVIDEIIGDELNHQSRLKELYEMLTEIKEIKD